MLKLSKGTTPPKLFLHVHCIDGSISAVKTGDDYLSGPENNGEYWPCPNGEKDFS